MGRRKRDDNKGKSPNLESNDPIKAIGTKAEPKVRNEDSVIKQGGFQNPELLSNQANPESTGDPKMSAQNIASKNDPKNTEKRSKGNQAQRDAEKTPNNIAEGYMFPPVSFSQIPMGDKLLVAQYQIARTFSLPLPSYGNTNLQGQQSVIRNQIPILFGTPLVPQQQTGNYQQHQAEVGHVQPPTQPLIGQGSPTEIPQASDILGQPSPRTRTRESSPPVGPSKKTAISPIGSRGLNVNHSPPPSPRHSSPASPPPAVLQDSSQPFKPSKCMLCKRDENEQSVDVLRCGHVFHSECLKRVTPKDQAKNPPCIACVWGGCK